MTQRGNKRHALAGPIPRPAKRTAGRTKAALTPANIRVRRTAMPDGLDDYVRRRLGFKLGKFATYIERATVRLDDVNGPKGGIDKTCRIKVVMSRHDSVVVTAYGHDVRAVCDDAMNRIERAVRKARESARAPSAAARRQVRRRKTGRPE